MNTHNLKNFIIISCIFCVTACGSSGDDSFDGTSSYYDKDVPKIEKQRVGRPYQIGGRWYTPTIDSDYDETGIASWYGPGFHGRPTANGETFDENKISAAHTTLPLPSYVIVTNLDNGKQLYVRINDRGPFEDDRILDLSKRAAELLGSKSTGLARVRVRVAEPPYNVTLVTPEGDKIVGKGYKSSSSNSQIMVADNKTFNNPPIKNIAIASSAIPLYQGNYNNQPINTPPIAVNNTYYPSSVQQQEYAIKIGVFSNPNNISALEKNLSNLGQLKINPVYRNGRMLSEVFLGGYKSQQEARNTVDALTQFGINDAVIVNKETSYNNAS